MKRFSFIFIFFISFPLLAHMEAPLDQEQPVKEAEFVITATVLSHRTKESRCEKSDEYDLQPQKLLEGKLDLNQKLIFDVTRYFPRKAEWPWQKDCPSVWYFVPPKASNMDQGTQILVVGKKNTYGNNPLFFITGTFDLSEKEKVLNLFHDSHHP